jgi:hypothetical protein
MIKVMPEKRKAKTAEVKQAAPKKNPVGRPTDYNPELIDEICDRIASGEPLVRICREDGMPRIVTVYRWLNKYPEFSNLYAKAKDAAADTLAEEIQDISDSMPMETTDKEGNTRFDPAYIQWMRLRVDARKWVAAKLKPKKYGERTTITGDADNPLHTETTIKANELFTSILQNMELKKQQASNE